MAGLFRLTALVLVPILSALYAYRGSLLSISVATVECTALKILLGSKVSFPTSNVYTASLDEYFSAQEKALVPSCIIRPQDSKDVATAIHALSLANKFGIGGVRFAIRGQGHTPWAGAANINGGITIDMRATKSISVNQGQTVTSVGSGAQWLDVYMTLDALGLSVSGGRVADVGVGGLTTGGGLSFFAPRYGFVCDNVINYEVVLASGEIVNVNSDHNQDLFFALKGGSNNFGVVTRFDLKTFPQGKFWGGVIINPVTTLHSQLEAFHELSIAPDYNVYSAVVNNFYYNSATDTMYAVNFIEYTKAEEYPASLKSFTDIEPVLQSTMRVSNLSDFTIEQANYAPNGQRSMYVTTTFKPSLSFLHEVFTLYNTSLQVLLPTVKNLGYSLTYQAIPTAIISKSVLTGGNAMGLDRYDEPLVLSLLSVSWLNETDDALITDTAKKLFDDIDKRAAEENLAVGWKYLNYAAKWQDVIGGYGEVNKGKLQEASRKYDPDGLFQRGVPGGYKLFAQTGPESAPDEL